MNGLNVISLSETNGRRLLVTSDIHGHIDHLNTLLTRAEFSGNDLLVVVGDLLDKGPHSLEVVRRVMTLCEEGRAIVLSGNVDNRVMSGMDTLYRERIYDGWTLDYLCSMRRWKGSSFYDDLCREATGTVPNTEEELLGSLDAVYSHFEKELQFVRTLPTVLKTPKYLFVHGGLPEGAEPQGLESDPEKDPFPFLKLDRFLEHARASGRRFDRYIVCGHWPVSLYCHRFPCANPIIDDDIRVISIDGGCGIKRDGQLNMLLFPSLDCEPHEIECLRCDGLPTMTATAAQKCAEQSVNIRWIDCRVKILALEKDVAEIEQISTGCRMWVPADFLGDPKKLAVGMEVKTHDCSDYRLPVSVGDILSVVKETSRGIYAKKNGVSGWYINR